LASFAYTAVDINGREKKGSFEAENKERATGALKNQGLIPLTVTEQGALSKDISFGARKIKPRDMSLFCRQFVSIIKAGVPIVEALSMLADQTENKRFAKAIGEVKLNVEKGETLGNSMRLRPDIFPSMLINLVDAGEASGSLDNSLTRMAVQFEKDAKIKGLVKKAMIYPIIVGIVAVAVVVVMLIFVIPNFTDMFSQMDMKMPAITQAVIDMSDFVRTKWYILIAIIAVLVFAIKSFNKSEAGQAFFGTLGIKLPAIGNFTVKSACSRMARTMSTLLYSGIPMVDAIDITTKTMTNIHFRRALENAKEEVMKGVPFSEPLKRSGVFPPMVYHMVGIGENTGDIEEMLLKMADYYDEEVEIATQSLIAAMEPMIIIVLAGIVGVLIAAVMAPMLAMYQGLDNL